EILADQTAYAEITFNGAKTTFLLSSITSRTQVNFMPCFRFQIPVKAKELRDEAVLKIFTGSNEPVFLLNQNGEDVTDKGAAYSVQDYLTRIQKTGSATMIKLAKAAEDYGIAAQLYFKYKHDGLTIPENVTAVTPGEMAAHAPKEQGTLPTGITKSANSVLFQSDNTLRMYYFYNSGTALSKYTCTVDGKAGKITNQPDSLRFYVQYPAIAAKNLDDVHTFVITDSKSTHTYKISAIGYAYKMVTTSKDPTMVDLAKALYLYNIAAVEHLGK
ncbi:MAG: hypothetical protein IIY77_00875, partial [Lachnospiraceae bacterium]|nr:hypothetical protein [Lachnospiraceae bacterium]